MVEGIIVSVKGRERASNQDYAIFHRGERAEIWMIADGATCAKGSGAFITTFCDSLLDYLIAFGASFTADDALTAIRMTHQEIRRQFICAKGSFLLFVVEKNAGIQYCLYLGDCRIGSVKAGRVTWHSLPHNLVAASQVTDEQQICHHPQRHILFRPLAARRLEKPTFLPLSLDLSLPIVMATDGFWCNSPATLPENLSPETLAHHLSLQANQADDMTVLIRHCR